MICKLCCVRIPKKQSVWSSMRRNHGGRGAKPSKDCRKSHGSWQSVERCFKVFFIFLTCIAHAVPGSSVFWIVGEGLLKSARQVPVPSINCVIRLKKMLVSEKRWKQCLSGQFGLEVATRAETVPQVKVVSDFISSRQALLPNPSREVKYIKEAPRIQSPRLIQG